jgi:Icc-related predicted phosphoesterase
VKKAKTSRRGRQDSASESTARAGTVVRVLTVSDLHQRIALLNDLSQAVETHAPDVVAIVGDVLEAIHVDAAQQYSAAQCANRLAALPVEHLLFIRGNHEHLNWGEFVCAWPYSRRSLLALYGTSYTVGPMTLIGFPCHTGSEFVWCRHLEAQRDCMKPAPDHDRLELPVEHDRWLPQLLRETGPSGRTLWLMHEPPIAAPLASKQLCNPEWAAAIKRFQPLVTVSGHEHHPTAWHATLDTTVSVNIGQAEDSLRFCVLDFHFVSDRAGLPAKVEIVAYPTQQRLQVRPG